MSLVNDEEQNHETLQIIAFIDHEREAYSKFDGDGLAVRALEDLLIAIHRGKHKKMAINWERINELRSVDNRPLYGPIAVKRSLPR